MPPHGETFTGTTNGLADTVKMEDTPVPEREYAPPMKLDTFLERVLKGAPARPRYRSEAVEICLCALKISNRFQWTMDDVDRIVDGGGYEVHPDEPPPLGVGDLHCKWIDGKKKPDMEPPENFADIRDQLFAFGMETVRSDIAQLAKGEGMNPNVDATREHMLVAGQDAVVRFVTDSCRNRAEQICLANDLAPHVLKIVEDILLERRRMIAQTRSRLEQRRVEAALLDVPHMNAMAHESQLHRDQEAIAAESLQQAIHDVIRLKHENPRKSFSQECPFLEMFSYPYPVFRRACFARAAYAMREAGLDWTTWDRRDPGGRAEEMFVKILEEQGCHIIRNEREMGTTIYLPSALRETK